jgi:diguanylate cyclase (GGDEF)-like protein/PAS domain S-box-containing protein
VKLPNIPLWLKILVTASLVQTLVLLALGYTSVTTFNKALQQQSATRINELRPLLNTNIASALFERDIAGIKLLLKRIQRDDGIAYLQLIDDNGRLIATEGKPTPEAIHQTLPIQINDMTIGTLTFDVSTATEQRAQKALLLHGFRIIFTTMLLATALLLASSIWLTKRLRQLSLASEVFSNGNLQIRLPEINDDEIGKLNIAFNRMADTLQKQIADLHILQTQLQSSLEMAHAEQARLTALLSTMNLGILFVDNQGAILYSNPAFNKIWRLSLPEQINGHLAKQVLHESSIALANPSAFSEHMTRPGKRAQALEIDMADGRTITHTIRTIHNIDGQPIGELWVFDDITQSQLAASQLIYLAERDALTGLYNRHSFEKALNTTFIEHARTQQAGALLFIDLDGFKHINDTFGHHAGDETLIRIAGVMSSLIRAGEALYRLGGDEFAILLNVASPSDAQTLASRVVSAVAQIPFHFEGQHIRITSSIGIALFPMHAQNTETLVSRADAAMYQAKLAGKNNWRIYQAEQDNSRDMVQTMQWSRRIEQALEHELFVLHFQGVFHTHSNQISHYEALIRLRETPDAELIAPSHFISVAEQSGQILAIDRWVLRHSISTLAAHPDVPAIAVNLSGRSLDDTGLIDYILDLLTHNQIDHTRLMFEITETAALSDLQDAQRTIRALRQMGCSVSLDDFGTGFASFAYLKYLDADVLKIDGLFVRNLCEETDNRVFIKAIVDVAHGLGKKTVAECVETAEIHTLLQELGVDMMQGYFLHKPAPLV